MTIDIKDFYLNTPLEQLEYIKLKLNNLTKDFIKKYDLAPKIDQNGYVYIEIRRRMYRLPQSRTTCPKAVRNTIKRKMEQSEHTSPCPLDPYLASHHVYPLRERFRRQVCRQATPILSEH